MKNLLITGATGGIGSQITKQLAKKGNRLILFYNKNETHAEQLRSQLQNKCEIYFYKCDLTNEIETNNLVNDIIKTFKHVDVFVHCAGISIIKQIQDCTPNDYSQIFDLNVKSAINITSQLAKSMIHHQFGRIVYISSMWGKVGASMESVYSASKGAINSLTLSLAKELGPSNINVNAICPGLIDTPMNRSLNTQTKKDIVESTPISRIGTPKDVANLVEFLISDKSSFVTGQIITIDGGFSL